MTRFIMSPVNNKETKQIAKSLKKQKHAQAYFSSIIYMEQNPTIKALQRNLKEGDTIELHAEGWPWVIGSLDSSKFDYSPYHLADFFSQVLANKKELPISIEIRACNSGTIATGPNGEICFAQHLSEALSALGFHNIEVKGYAGYIQSENPLKQSIVGHATLSRAKLAHCPLDEGEVTFQNGTIKKPAKKIIVREYSYDCELEENQTALVQFFKDKATLEQKALAAKTIELLSQISLSPSSIASSSDAPADACFQQEPSLASLCHQFQNLEISRLTTKSLSFASTSEKDDMDNTVHSTLR